MPVGAYLLAWHFSLQHEAIHSFRGVPAWLRFAVVFPPLGLWFPYPLYRKSHTTHHRDINLTIPGVDTESYYVLQADWARMGALKRRVLMFNQTMAGRLLIGPMLRLWTLVIKETRRVRQGDYSHLPHWACMSSRSELLFWFISGVCGFPWWQYCLLVAYPGLSLGLLRAFTEHRAAAGLSGANRIRGIQCAVRLAVPLQQSARRASFEARDAVVRNSALLSRKQGQLLASNGNFVYRRICSACAALFSDSRIQPRSSDAVDASLAQQNPRDRRDLDRQHARVVRLHGVRTLCGLHRRKFLPRRRPEHAAAQNLPGLRPGVRGPPAGRGAHRQLRRSGRAQSRADLDHSVDGRRHRHHRALPHLCGHRDRRAAPAACSGACCRAFRQAARSAARPPICWRAPTLRNAAASHRGSRPAWGWPIYWARWRRSRSLRF